VYLVKHVYPKLSQHVRVIPSSLAPYPSHLSDDSDGASNRSDVSATEGPTRMAGADGWTGTVASRRAAALECFEWSLVTSMRQERDCLATIRSSPLFTSDRRICCTFHSGERNDTLVRPAEHSLKHAYKPHSPPTSSSAAAPRHRPVQEGRPRRFAHARGPAGPGRRAD
jgi:hypothetical protein